ncbi:hypothetical protein QZH41_015546 [Actinostola sp. cb2023]|nr:hypothetical protein QZH41_015546 [Actinostola sp. cb2023]
MVKANAPWWGQLINTKSPRGCCEALEDTQNPSLAKRFLSLVAETDAITSNVFYLSPFKDSCFSVHIPVDHHIKHNDHVCLTFNRIRWQFPLSLIFGLILFLHAESLSRSATFYYSSGIVLGVGFSLLLAVFLLHRFVPSRAGAYALLAGGWSVSLYFLQWSWNNLVNLVLERNIFVIGYFTLAGVISFCLCYYNGPVTNDRGINLIRWTIQLIATYFIYKGVQPESLSVAVVVVVYTYNFASSDLVQRILSILPQNFISYKVQYYLFPPKTRLLTANEYEAEGMIQTRTHITDQEYEQFEEDPFEYSSPDDSEECVND